MNILNKTKVYLCGPMEYVSNGLEWREEAAEKLAILNISVFTPYNKPFVVSVEENSGTKARLYKSLEDGNYMDVHNHMKQIRAYDLRCVDLSDFVIAKINPKIASWGSADEIYTALRMRKPLFLIIEGGIKKTPLWLMGSLPPSFIFDSFDSVLERLKDIDSGNIQLDSKYWKLLKPEFR